MTTTERGEGETKSPEQLLEEKIKALYGVIKEAVEKLEDVKWNENKETCVKSASVPGRDPGSRLKLFIDERNTIAKVSYEVPGFPEQASVDLQGRQYIYLRQRRGDINFQKDSIYAEENIRSFVERLPRYRKSS